MAAAAELFELGQLSSGAAARLAGVPCTVFLSRLVDYGVDTFRLTQDELLKETRLVRGHLQHVAVAVFASDRAIAYPNPDTPEPKGRNTAHEILAQRARISWVRPYLH